MDKGFTFNLKVDYLATYPKEPPPFWRASVSSVVDANGKELLKDCILEWDCANLVQLLNELKIMIPRTLKANGIEFNG